MAFSVYAGVCETSDIFRPTIDVCIIYIYVLGIDAPFSFENLKFEKKM